MNTSWAKPKPFTHFRTGRRVAQRIWTEADVALLQVDLSGLVIQPLELEVEASGTRYAGHCDLKPKGPSSLGFSGDYQRSSPGQYSTPKGHRYLDFIQTDAAINKGSRWRPAPQRQRKGRDGHRDQENSDGLAFAIPSTWLNAIFNRLKEAISNAAGWASRSLKWNGAQ